YLGTDVSCNMLGACKIIVWVNDKFGNVIASEEITEDRTIRQSVLYLLENEESIKRSREPTLAKIIPADKVEAEAVDQD
ncbi:MAG TPA: hypothetical protein PK891_03970, partial [Bacteroidales bacterium]|nr:hypothetical protein [Bacteroidales bacterium]